MPRRCHHRYDHEAGVPCSCEMGNLYRYTEPIMLLALAQLGEAHGYQLVQQAETMAVTHAGLDSDAIYRTLRRLEAMGRVRSSWDTSGQGPARRVYVLTASGVAHLGEWAQVLAEVTSSLLALTGQCTEAARRLESAPGPQAEPRPRRSRARTGVSS